MRRVARTALPVRTARALKRASEALAAAIASGSDPSIGPAYKRKGIQRVLRDRMFEGCCCFCEANTESTNYGQVEHYRPKARAEFKHLAFTWENLLWSCGRCNGPKGDSWNSAAPLLDPTIDDPAAHLQWNDAVVRDLTSRGKYTIALLDLNGERNLHRYEQRRDHLEAARLARDAAAHHPDAEIRETARALLGRLVGPRAAYRGMLAADGIDASNVG